MSRRVLRAVGTLLVIATAVFIVMRVIPGDPALVQLGDYATPELVLAVESDLGLDRPLAEQYVDFMTRLVRGDAGFSFRSHRPVSTLLTSSGYHTLILAVASFTFAIVFGVAGGLVAARFRNTIVDRAIGAVSTLALSAPTFWTGLLLIYVFSLQLGWLPVAGGGSLSDPIDLLQHLALPMVAIGAREAGIIARVVRNAMEGVMRMDFVMTAVAKGIGRTRVLNNHVLRNALLPVVSMASVRFITLLSGIFVVEIVFARPGLGSLLVDAIQNRDYPVVQGVVLVIGVFVILINFIGDAIYRVADPRVRARA
jgi:peptide/nickel transport system permease protein